MSCAFPCIYFVIIYSARMNVYLQVKIEKYLTPEQRRKQEEDDRREAERRAKEKGDNWRDRGLDQMMGGVLEIKKEDELKKVNPSYSKLRKLYPVIA